MSDAMEEAMRLDTLNADVFRDAAPGFTLRVPSSAVSFEETVSEETVFEETVSEETVSEETVPEETPTTIQLEIARIDGLAGDTPRADGEPFSVVFRCLEGHTLPQAIYRLENESIGALDLFLVCLGPDPKGEGSLFEAVFT
ncbi:MAG: hypothetical protein AAGC60_06095 [Acidobacteriota bacterium]